MCHELEMGKKNIKILNMKREGTEILRNLRGWENVIKMVLTETG